MSIERKAIIGTVITTILDKYEITRNDNRGSNTILIRGTSEDRMKICTEVSYNLMLPFIHISYPETQLNVGPQDIAKIFNMCNAMPCVLLLEGLTQYQVNAWLSIAFNMDKMSKDTVLIIAANNSIDKIDPTILSRISIAYDLT